MNHSEQINEIAAALAKAQAKMGAAIKDATNPHFRSKYADLASIVDAVRGPLTESGICFTQWPMAVESGVSVITLLAHSSGQWIKGEVFVPVSKADAQGYGSAITYGKRYGLQSACGVPSDDDDGNAAASAKPASIQAKITPAAGAMDHMTPDQRREMEFTADEVGRRMREEGAKAAHDYIESYEFSNENKVALWSLLDSKTRAALKAAANAVKDQA